MLAEFEERCLSMVRKLAYLGGAKPQESGYVARGAVAKTDPDHFGRRAEEHAEAKEIFVSSDDYEIISSRSIPDGAIACAAEAERDYVC